MKDVKQKSYLKAFITVLAVILSVYFVGTGLYTGNMVQLSLGLAFAYGYIIYLLLKI